MPSFDLISDFTPKGDQGKAIEKLSEGIESGKKEQVLLGVTGSGKTYTVAKMIEEVQCPTLVIAHNKTLAAQLFKEFKEFFPHNAVEFFVSYYDYYQPEAYIPSTDTYIEKDASINDEIDRLRHQATKSLYERRDVIIVSSVSCIYNMGSPEVYYDQVINLEVGMEVDRDEILMKLVERQYTRNDYELERGSFRAKGDVLEIFPSYEEMAMRVEFFGDEIYQISLIDPLSGQVKSELDSAPIYPKTHYVTTAEDRHQAYQSIKEELRERVKELRENDKYEEADRLWQKTSYDLEMMQEVGYCHGIENYSRHLSNREAGEPPKTLIDYLPDDAVMVIDESHATIPQIKGMYRGDRSRKLSLVEHGFRLPSALDNRPLKFEEFEKKKTQMVYVSATPGPYELEQTNGEVVEQIIRPTGLMDPEITVKPIEHQVDDLQEEIRFRAERDERVLVTTLTKKMAEDLTQYYKDVGINTRYLHSEIDTLERVEILRELRSGEFDALIGVNLLREGLDLPEVSLVAIMDADKEGFLRSERSLMQTAGRAARNLNGEVIMYADKITGSMRKTIDETNRRRKIQKEYNEENDVTPKTIKKAVSDTMQVIYEADYLTPDRVGEEAKEYSSVEEIEKKIEKLEKKMQEAADELEFEKAARYRDEIQSLKEVELYS